MLTCAFGRRAPADRTDRPPLPAAKPLPVLAKAVLVAAVVTAGLFLVEVFWSRPATMTNEETGAVITPAQLSTAIHDH